MTIRHTLTRLDLLLFNGFIVFRLRFLYIIWILLTLFTSYNNFKKPDPTVQGLVVFILIQAITAGVFFILLFGLCGATNSLVMLFRKNLGILGEHRITITDEGIIEATEYNESLFKWSAYCRTIWTRRFIVLQLNEGMYHPVPRLRPLIEGNLAEFEAELRRRASND